MGYGSSVASTLGALGKGAVAGLAGTALMTGYQEALARARGGSAVADSLKEPRTWAEAPAPAQLAKKVSEGVLGRRVTKRQAPLITNVARWGTYGASLGAAYGLAASRSGRNPILQGLAFGVGAWAAAYAALTPLGLNDYPWRAERTDLAVDISSHLVYGVAAAAVFDALD
jgi:hypothetical protein